MRKVLVIFDIDGTLTDTNKIDHYCFAETYKRLHQVDWENFNWDGVPHISDSGLANSYFLDAFKRLPTASEIDTLQNEFMRLMHTEFERDASKFLEIKGAGNIFKSLAAYKKYDVALATGCWKRSAKFKLNAANILYDNIPLAHADHHYDRAEITKTAIELSKRKYGNSYEQIVYVGDGVWDAETTTKLKIPFVGIDYHANEKLKKFGTEVIIQSYSTVEKFEQTILEAIATFEKNNK